jgi:hypothetical protein
MRKVIIIALLTAAISCTTTTPGMATSSVSRIKAVSVKSSAGSIVKPYPVTVKLNGKTIKDLGSKSKIKNGLIYLPLQPIAKGLGYKIKVTSREILMTKSGIKAEFIFSTNQLTIGTKTIKMKSTTLKYSNYNYVTLTFLRKALTTTCDWFPAVKTAVIYSAEKELKSLYQRLYDSGEYKLYPQQIPTPYKFGCPLVHKNKKYNFSISIDMSDPIDCRSDLHIKIRGYDKATREKVKEILALAYPYRHKEVYKQFIATIREELYKNDWDPINHPGISFVYYESRLLNIYKQLESADFVTFDIGVKNRKYPKPAKAEEQLAPCHSNPKELKALIKKHSIYYEK